MREPTTMRALLLRQHGGLEQPELVDAYPRPVATPGHVVIRVRASSFNDHDVFTVRGMPGIKVPLPVSIGLDMAGEIVELGAGVSGWQVDCWPAPTCRPSNTCAWARHPSAPCSWQLAAEARRRPWALQP